MYTCVYTNLFFGGLQPNAVSRSQNVYFDVQTEVVSRLNKYGFDAQTNVVLTSETPFGGPAKIRIVIAQIEMRRHIQNTTEHNTMQHNATQRIATQRNVFQRNALNATVWRGEADVFFLCAGPATQSMLPCVIGI